MNATNNGIDSDFMMALLIASTTLVALSPVFLALVREPIKEKRDKYISVYMYFLWASLIAGLSAVVYILLWFVYDISKVESLAVIFFAVQIVSFTFGSSSVWLKLAGIDFRIPIKSILMFILVVVRKPLKAIIMIVKKIIKSAAIRN